MMVNQYLWNILFQKKAIFSSDNQAVILDNLVQQLTEWSNACCVDEIFQAGSVAKGTAVKGKSDCDIFISINHSCKNSMSEIFYSLIDLFGKNYVRKQNVSIGLKLNGYSIDIVPGKRQSDNTNYHCIYKSKQDSWTQTNVKKQIEHIRNSKLTNHIKLAKIWRDCHKLDFPSINIELAVLDALKHREPDNLSNDFKTILEYFAKNLQHSQLVDISNSNNIISDDMTTEEKSKVAKCASSCLDYTWQEIIW